MWFSSFLYLRFFFPRYQFVDFANCTICVFSYQRNCRIDIKIIIYIYIYTNRDPENLQRFYLNGSSVRVKNNNKNIPHIIIIIIIIMSCRLHEYPWPSLATSPNRSSPLAGLRGYIPYPHIAAVCMFELVVLLLLGHMRVSIGVHHLWARPCFSSSVLHVWFV